MFSESFFKDFTAKINLCVQSGFSEISQLKSSDLEENSIWISQTDDVENESGDSFQTTGKDNDTEQTGPYVGKTWNNEEAVEQNKAKNKSKLPFDDNYPISTKIEDIQKDDNGFLYIIARTTTTSPDITDEEAEMGIVNKETVQYPTPGFVWSTVDSHKDIFTYDDGTELTNYYDNGTGLSRQKEVSYSDGCDPNNLKDGDTKTTIMRTYNDDGSYIEIKTTVTYNSQFGGFVDDLVARPSNYKAFDAQGNELQYGSQDYKNAMKGLMQLPGTKW